jgi:hypothetical protein
MVDHIEFMGPAWLSNRCSSLLMQVHLLFTKYFCFTTCIIERFLDLVGLGWFDIISVGLYLMLLMFWVESFNFYPFYVETEVLFHPGLFSIAKLIHWLL